MRSRHNQSEWAAWSRRLIRRRMVLAAGILTLVIGGFACGEPEVTEFRRGDRVQMGDWEIRVSHVEVLSASAVAGFEGFRIDEDRAKILAIHLTVDHDSEADDPLSGPYGKAIKLMSAFRLRDGDSNQYRLGAPLPERHYGWMRESATSSMTSFPDPGLLTRSGDAEDRQWVLLFAVPEQARGFALRFKAKRPREGQPALASVDLGR